MLRRYRLLEEAGVRHVQSYNLNPKATEHIPYLIICIDELADLMMTSSFDVEQSICRLAQLGRATGIHLDVVTGLIKANFPSRISFAVASQVDSRTILDAAGAERLLGKGDMLFLSSDAAKPRRIQGVFISEEESAALADHWRSHDLMTIPEIPLEDLAREAMAVSYTNTDNQGRGDGDDDAIYKKALDIAVTSRALSTSLLQRRLRIGYPRAARLMDQLEDDGIVAPSGEPGKPREVLYVPPNDG
jgi:S-DNA-T family DNA segregation ATPase FtsK/SpoIIIE